MEPAGRLIREIPVEDRPRERLERLGAENLSDAEILAVLLRTGRQGMSVMALAESLLKRFGSLAAVGKQTVQELAAVDGLGHAKAVTLHAAFEVHRRVVLRGLEEKPLSGPAEIYRLMEQRTRSLSVEVLFGLALDSKLRLIRCYPVTTGLVNQTLAHPREVFREAIAASSAHLALVHNHPSGDPKPSADDIRTTREMMKAGQVLGIPLIDHVIIGIPSPANPSGYISLKEMGIIEA